MVLPILLALAFGGVAQVKVPQKSTTPPADYSKEAFVIEKLYTRVNAADDGTNTRAVTAEIKIQADAGVKAFAVLSFTYTSANEVVDVDYVRVRKPDGTVVKTPDYNIQDMPGEVTRTAPMYSDIHEKHVAVKGLAVGDVLEYTIRYRTIKPQVPGQFWFEANFIKDAIVKDERLEIAVPSSKYVKLSSPEFKPEVREEAGQRTYSWVHSNLSRPDTTPQPKRTPPPPSVQVTTFKNWEEIGRWYGALQKDAVTITPEIQQQALQLTANLKTDEDKVRAIYEFVSLKYHYIGLDFGIGRYQPHAADDVLGNGYGDCKDKHTLLAALLKAAGFEAWPALIHSVRKLDPEIPSPAQFNHVITVVPLGGKYIWLDTTPEVAPYGLLLANLRDKEALVIPPGLAPLLMRTPGNPPIPQLQTFTSQGKLDANGTYSGHVEQSCRGDVEVVMRTIFRQVSQSQWKEAMQRISYGMGFGGDVSNVTVSSPEDMSQPFRFSYDYERKSYSDWENQRITPPLPAMGIESTKDSKKPEESVLLGAVGEIRYESKLTLPPGYSTAAPPNVDLVKPYAEYHASANLGNGVLTTSRRLMIKKTEVALGDWEDYRAFGEAVSDDEYRYVYLNGESAGVKGAQPACQYRRVGQGVSRRQRGATAT
jgi:transglutaminase-like putative cysteine protease